MKYFLQIQVNTAGNSNSISLLDWFTSKTFNQYLTIQTGRSCTFYTYEYYDNPGQLSFRGSVNAEYAFLLQRAIGVQLSGQVGKLGYAGEVMNSVPALDAGGQENIGTARWPISVISTTTCWSRMDGSETDPSLDGATKPELTLWLSGMYNPVEYAIGFQNALPGDQHLRRHRLDTVPLRYSELPGNRILPPHDSS